MTKLDKVTSTRPAQSLNTSAWALFMALAIGCAHRAPFAYTDIEYTGVERVTLDASPCFGPCPAFRVSVSADGNVAFEGRSHAVAHGHSRIDIARLELRTTEQTLHNVCHGRAELHASAGG